LNLVSWAVPLAAPPHTIAVIAERFDPRRDGPMVACRWARHILSLHLLFVNNDLSLIMANDQFAGSL